MTSTHFSRTMVCCSHVVRLQLAASHGECAAMTLPSTPTPSLLQFPEATLFKGNMANWVDLNDYYSGGLKGTIALVFTPCT